jgi:hypothetical protein
MTSTPSRVIYPELPDPLTPGDLQQLFSPSLDERAYDVAPVVKVKLRLNATPLLVPVIDTA